MAALAGPVAVAAAWTPLRGHLPNVDVALLLVFCAALCGLRGSRLLVAAAAVGAGGGFTYFDTSPYDRLAISKEPDVITLAVLVAVSLALGDLAVRLARQRHRPGAGREDMTRIRDLAALVASGAELVEVIGAAAAGLAALLGAASAEYQAGPPLPGAWMVTPEAVLAAVDGSGRPRAGAAPASGRIDLNLPVRGMGAVIGRFGIQGVDVRRAGPGPLMVALTLTDQIGAALIAQAPESAVLPEAPEEQARPVLRVIE